MTNKEQFIQEIREVMKKYNVRIESQERYETNDYGEEVQAPYIPEFLIPIEGKIDWCKSWISLWEFEDNPNTPQLRKDGIYL